MFINVYQPSINYIIIVIIIDINDCVVFTLILVPFYFKT